MKKMLVLGLLAAATLVTANPPVRAVDQDDIDKAVEKGSRALRMLQRPDGSWPHEQIGATALAGLTLLECGAGEDDRAVLRAAEAVRRASIRLTHTYSISLSILFLDRLGDPGDVPLIESLMVRLLAGQNPTFGGWSYTCPNVDATELRRLEGKLNERKELVGRRETPKPGKKRTLKDLSPEIREQLERLERDSPRSRPPGGGTSPGGRPGFPQDRPDGLPPGRGFTERPAPGGPPGFPPPRDPAPGFPPQGQTVWGIQGDNSNTQFAAFALWVGRRHGFPIEKALTRLDRRFRNSQLGDGGWPYEGPDLGLGVGFPGGPGSRTTATMTCAGLIALALCDGATVEEVRERKPDARVPDVNKDVHLARGLQALGEVIGNPRGIRIGPPAPGTVRPRGAGGRTYYFLWSLERVAVGLNLDTIGKKNWYGWGAEILLANQDPDGGWYGEYGAYGADTCFALLFLKRANLTKDLTAQIKGKLEDPGERVLVGGKRKPIRSGIESKEAKPIEKPVKPADSESLKLAEGFLKANGAGQSELLEQLQSGKGTKYTEALALAIPKLEGEMHRKAREALANRLTRMKDQTLADYLQDEDAEIRRAAALAVGQKESKTLVPNLISLLRDPDISVVRTAHASLKALTNQDFGPSARATREERDQAVLKWIEWWAKQRRKPARE